MHALSRVRECCLSPTGTSGRVDNCLRGEYQQKCPLGLVGVNGIQALHHEDVGAGGPRCARDGAAPGRDADQGASCPSRPTRTCSSYRAACRRWPEAGANTAGRAWLVKPLDNNGIQVYLTPSHPGSAAARRTPTDCFVSICPRRQTSRRSPRLSSTPSLGH
jgi:hypothetical protein